MDCSVVCGSVGYNSAGFRLEVCSLGVLTSQQHVEMVKHGGMIWLGRRKWECRQGGTAGEG
jgi:hypothetical protein